MFHGFVIRYPLTINIAKPAHKIVKRWILTACIAVLVILLLALILFSAETARVRVATTTSLYATSLLENLAEAFTSSYNDVAFDFIAVGSGEALRRAEMGDACLVFVHAPSLEKQYISKNVIIDQRIVAYNYFIVVGPFSDPAEVLNAESALDAFKKIYQAGERGEAFFVSRGDSSGTHLKELSIWNKAGLDPRGKAWYKETGSGMSQTLLIAQELKAYTISDIGTYLKFREKVPDLKILYEGGEDLINIYSVYLVSSCAGEELKASLRFMEFVSREAQEIIESYGVDEFGKQLFYPARDRLPWLESMWRRLADLGEAS